MKLKNSTINRKKLGKINYKKGYDFEDQVAELYRLQHYKVEHGRIFSGRQVDFFLERKIADLTIYRAIECKSGPVKTEHIDSFLAKLSLIRKEYPTVLGTMVSSSTFTDAVTSHAHAEGIQLTLFRDLAAQLFDGQAYVKNLQRDIDSNDRYNSNLYIEPYISQGIDAEFELAFQVIEEWLLDDNLRQLTILGDVGTGKSFLSKMIASKLAEKFLKQPLDNPIPVLIDLRNADRQMSLEGLIITHFTKSGISDISFDVFQYALSRGNLILILDGFDEMASRVTPQITTRNFNELIRSIKGRAKVILTCRTHYFKSRTEEEEIILGQSDTYENDSVKELYWDLISRKGYKIVYLNQFNERQIENYVAKALPKTNRKALSKIYKTYNLLELSQRPMLLNMIVQAIDKIGDDEINQATLYKVFTNVWINRDKWRDVISPENKLKFLMELARKLWQEGATNIHYSNLNTYINEELSNLASSEQEKLEIDNEIRTASFLTRNTEGDYGFAHKSYQEYFFARYLTEHFQKDDFTCLLTKELTYEVISFLCCLFDISTIETKLEQILTNKYKPSISENALILLYGIRKHNLLKNGEVDQLFIEIPQDVNLEGAQLDQVVLDGIQLIRANLKNASFKEAVLTNANLSNSDLTNVNFSKARLKNANFKNSDLTFCNFSEANLNSIDFTNSKVFEANFSNAFVSTTKIDGLKIQNCIFENAQLSLELSKVLRESQNLGIPNYLPKETNETEQLWTRLISLKPLIVSFPQRIVLPNKADIDDLYYNLVTKIFSNDKRISRLNEIKKDNLLIKEMRIELNKLIRTYRSKNVDPIVPIELTSYEIGENELVNFNQKFFLDDVITYSNSYPDPSKLYENRILLMEIIKFIKNNMNDTYITIFVYYFFEDLDISEIAIRLGISIEQIHSRLRHLRKVIKSNFS